VKWDDESAGRREFVGRVGCLDKVLFMRMSLIRLDGAERGKELESMRGDIKFEEWRKLSE